MPLQFISTLQTAGLSKNEAEVYETLMTHGQLSVGQIAKHAKIHRRNVYDTVGRLLEKGLVFEVLEGRETHYQAVDPKKVLEILAEKQERISQEMSLMQQVYLESVPKEAVYIYKGLEGWKNYMRNILRIGQNDYVIGAKGAWSDPSIHTFAKQFVQSAHKKGIKFKLLYDAGTEASAQKDAEIIKGEYRILPNGIKTPSAIEFFGDHMVIFSDVSDAKIRDDLSITVIVNPKITESFKIWFEMMWKISKPVN